MNFVFTPLCRVAAVIVASAAAGSLLAQDPADRAQITQQQTTATATTDTTASIPPSPNDEDLGQQEVMGGGERYQPFAVSAAVAGFYTSNAFLTHDDPKGDAFVVPAVALSYQPRLTPTLFGEVIVQQQFFYYDRFDDLNFGNFDARAGLLYIVPALHNIALRADYEYNRLTVGDDLNEELFADQSILLNAEVPFRFDDQTQLSIGGGAKISVFGDPDPPRRDDFDLYALYSVNAGQHVTVNLLARVVVRDYVLSDRVDVSENFSASISYRLVRWASLNAFTTVAANQSNHKSFDYSVANLGGGLSFLWRF